MGHTTSSSRTVLIHQTLLTILRLHVAVRGEVEEWMHGGDATEESRGLSNGSLFGARDAGDP